MFCHGFVDVFPCFVGARRARGAWKPPLFLLFDPTLTETYSPRPPCVPIVNWPLVRRGHWFVVDWPLVRRGHWFVVNWPSYCSFTGEARMFRLDEVGNYKKILIKGELALPPHPYKSMFFQCFFA